MAAFVEVASVQELPPGTGRTFHVGDKEIAIFNVDGEVYAIDDACAHAGASLGAGKLQGKVLTCRAHGFRYDVTTGEVTTGGFGVASYPAKVSDGRIFVAVDEAVEQVPDGSLTEHRILNMRSPEYGTRDR